MISSRKRRTIPTKDCSWTRLHVPVNCLGGGGGGGAREGGGRCDGGLGMRPELLLTRPRKKNRHDASTSESESESSRLCSFDHPIESERERVKKPIEPSWNRPARVGTPKLVIAQFVSFDVSIQRQDYPVLVMGRQILLDYPTILPIILPFIWPLHTHIGFRFRVLFHSLKVFVSQCCQQRLIHHTKRFLSVCSKMSVVPPPLLKINISLAR